MAEIMNTVAFPLLRGCSHMQIPSPGSQCACFLPKGHKTTDEIDSLSMEFRDFRATSDTHLPTFDPKNDNAAIDHYWQLCLKSVQLLIVKFTNFNTCLNWQRHC